jgi:small nuclear ribonucleoprotein (snRNP)-like protein
MQFTMPFDWNITRLEKQNQVLIHQEVSIPKPSELAAKSYTGTMNGIDVTKNLMLDDSNSTKNIVHFMLPKSVVLQIAEQVKNNINGTQTTTATATTSSESLMKFTLEPLGNVSSSTMADTHA